QHGRLRVRSVVPDYSPAAGGYYYDGGYPPRAGGGGRRDRDSLGDERLHLVRSPGDRRAVRRAVPAVAQRAAGKLRPGYTAVLNSRAGRGAARGAGRKKDRSERRWSENCRWPPSTDCRWSTEEGQPRYPPPPAGRRCG